MLRFFRRPAHEYVQDLRLLRLSLNKLGDPRVIRFPLLLLGRCLVNTFAGFQLYLDVPVRGAKVVKMIGTDILASLRFDPYINIGAR
jgi:hypothetical protein